MLIYSLNAGASRNLLLAMGVVLTLYSAYYAHAGDWVVAAAGLLVAVALFALGGLTAAAGEHPPPAAVAAALLAINIAAVVGITALDLEGIVWFAPLVFVNFLLGGVRPGTAVTLVSALLIIVLGGHFHSGDLVLNITGAVVLSLLMAATYGHGMQGRFERLESEALHDELTGLLNRRAFDRALTARLGELEERRTLALVLLDLDHFKDLNDRHGHPVGDRVLREFAQIATGNLRQTDYLYRYGGEEFAVMLDGRAEDALRVAEKIRVAVAQARFADGATGLTVSAGVAEARPGDTERNLVRRTDSALYRAKSLGRDRCEQASEPVAG